MADHGYVRLYGYRLSVTAGLACGLSCTLALSVTTAPLRRRMHKLWRDKPINQPLFLTAIYMYAFLTVTVTEESVVRPLQLVRWRITQSNCRA